MTDRHTSTVPEPSMRSVEMQAVQAKSVTTVHDGGHVTRFELENVARIAGWDSFTLLLLIAAWLDRKGQSAALLSDLTTIAEDE